MRTKKHLIILILFLPICLIGQEDSISINAELFDIASTGNHSPFLLQSQSYGKIPAVPFSSMATFGLGKELNQNNHQLDYAFRANATIVNFSGVTYIYFHELFAKGKLGAFGLTAGSKEEILGNQDSTLSGGGMLFSKNTRPMPKLTLGIEQFTPVPFTHNFLEIKGAISHGWFDNTVIINEYLHHKYLYLRVGGNLPVHFQYGLDHVCQWGGIIPGLGQQPSSFKDFISVFTAGHGGSGSSTGEQVNAIGNHIISQSMKLEIRFREFRINSYWQNISEDPPVRPIFLNKNNISDGLWGISIKNSSLPIIKGVLYEFLNTTDQSGTLFQKDGIIYGGQDYYFSNYLYRNGWNYLGRTIGTPYIAPNIQHGNTYDFSKNNRVIVHHLGLEGETNGYSFRIMASFSKNYGTYDIPFKTMIPNTSTLIEVNKKFEQFSDIIVGCKLGMDWGALYGNSFGFALSFKKSGTFFRY
jgi:Capsule assembly protein Wzi